MYSADITLNGETFQAMIDTGSSDLWVIYNIPGAKDQGFNSTLIYDGGQVSGTVQAATLEFAGYEVPDQFFMLVPEANNSVGLDVLIGLGPGQGSMIRFLGNSSAADPPLDRIFRQNTSTPNYLSVLLGRSDDPEEPYPGELTVGEVLSNYTGILNQPKLDVTIGNFTMDSVHLGQHWQTLLDQNGIIGPDGETIPIKTVVNNSIDPNKATVAFDTGYTYPQIPEYVAEAIYGKVNGSSLQNVTELGGTFWVVPCDEEINATFIFGGVHYPIHPLDLNFAVRDDFCVGAFQPFSYVVEESITGPLYDMMLGMAFLRNAYLLVDLGDFVDGSNRTTAPPYIQLLSVTNATQASEEFAQQRKNGTSLLANDLLRKTTKSTGKKIAAWIIGVIVVCVVIGLLLLGLCCMCLCRRRNNRNNAGPQQIWPVSQSYRSISDPTPQGADEMHLVHNDPVYNPEQTYRTAWDPNYKA
ncbi:hypothetical protein SERLA73DRAFT_89540 [Serpula lacrymans var. lacrymans S7.3]|uniref:Peptidase A1 domain-containing protein n=2 Tax=Serpula lacrymans var. lacrymans TaxID=341189 RepID=F8PXJ7_SERL3|nr:hypothetical protein SERLA73DRAFT_89540 [Serpula lacrymans var. lacrymans S7.3]